jgi:hypothetical protein
MRPLLPLLLQVQQGTSTAQQLAEETQRAGLKQQQQLDQQQQRLQELEAKIDKERQYQQQVRPRRVCLW